MNKTNMFLIIGMAGIFSMVVGPALSAVPADAQRSWTEECLKNNEPFKTGYCPGQSENSPNKKDALKNPGGQYPPGKQPYDPNPR